MRLSEATLRRDLARVIRQVRPQRILIQTPERNWERIPASHPDHMAAGEAAIQAVYPDARNPFAHPSLLDDEGLDAWSVSEVWVMGHPTLTHYVDITDAVDRKVPIVVVAAAAGGWLFFIQHQFEETTWDKAEGWDFQVDRKSVV